MRQLNQGLIYTNENCIGCNRCIGGCPVLGANVAVIINKENKIMVDGNKCIHCGHCLEVCTHGARDYRDDTARFFEDLRGGFRIAMLVDPSFFVEYPEQSGNPEETPRGWSQRLLSCGLRRGYPYADVDQLHDDRGAGGMHFLDPAAGR